MEHVWQGALVARYYCQGCHQDRLQRETPQMFPKAGSLRQVYFTSRDIAYYLPGKKSWRQLITRRGVSLVLGTQESWCD